MTRRSKIGVPIVNNNEKYNGMGPIGPPPKLVGTAVEPINRRYRSCVRRSIATGSPGGTTPITMITMGWACKSLLISSIRSRRRCRRRELPAGRRRKRTWSRAASAFLQPRGALVEACRSLLINPALRRTGAIVPCDAEGRVRDKQAPRRRERNARIHRAGVKGMKSLFAARGESLGTWESSHG